MVRLWLFIWLTSFSIIYSSGTNVIHKNNSYYFADRIRVKFKDSNTLSKSSNSLFQKYGPTQLKKAFTTESNSKVLENIYTLKFNSPYDVDYILKKVKSQPEVEWAEPFYLYETDFQPNDSLYQNNYQWYLTKIKAEQAWDVNQGDSTIVIGIVDTGVDWVNPDLAANIWTNTKEIPDNGIDDDGNGYIDDVRGWDFGGLDGTPDNNPMEDRADHGTLVAGLASAVTNNEIGMASLGFSCKIMPVKASQDNIRSSSGIALISYGYEAIVYAVDNGANVINCSWGGNSFSQADLAVVEYANSKGVLIVAAAGNDNSSTNFYPADYQGVLSVAATDQNDVRASFSNYGIHVDVSAPGVNIYSTWQAAPFYRSADGTSLASPIVTGLAAIVANQFPAYSGLQIGEQIRVNTENIDSLNTLLIGSGRINAYKSLTNLNSKSVRLSNVKFIEIGDGDGIFESGETVKIIPTFTNYLNDIANIDVQISTDNSNVQIVNNGGSIGSLTTLQSVETNSDFFTIEINANAAKDVDVKVKLTYNGTDYQDNEWVSFYINPLYNIQSTENLSTTFTSNGSIGFDDYPTNLLGNGLVYKQGPNILFEGALLYGTSAQTIVNCARDVNGNKDEDFAVVTPIELLNNDSSADVVNYAKFNDVYATPKSLGIETDFYSYSYNNIEDADYMFIRYSMTNKSLDTLNNFYIGQFYDFDISDTSYSDDMVNYDSLNGFGYAYDDNGDPITTHVGVAFLSHGSKGFFAMDSEGKSNPTISWDGFSDEEKWTSLTNGLKYKSSGPSDISLVVSGGPFTFLPNENHKFDFLISCGDNLESLTQTVIKAKQKYESVLTSLETITNDIPDKFELSQNYPNPFNPTTTIEYQIPQQKVKGYATGLTTVRLSVFDVLGKEINVLVNKKQIPGKHSITFNASNLSSGVYFYKLSFGDFVSVKKMILLK